MADAVIVSTARTPAPLLKKLVQDGKKFSTV